MNEAHYYTVGITYRNGSEKGRSFPTLREAAQFADNFRDAPNIGDVGVWEWHGEHCNPVPDTMCKAILTT